MHRRAPRASALALLAAALSAGPSEAAVLDRVGVYVDAWYASVGGSARIDDPGTGSRYDLSSDARLGGPFVGYEAGVWFHPAGRHRVRVAAMSLSGDGSGTLARPLSFGGPPAPAGTVFRSSFDLRLLEAHYAWSFVNLDIVNVAVLAGADGFDATSGVHAGNAAEEATFRNGLPVAGVTFQVQPAEFVRIYGEADFGAGISGTDARLSDLRLRVEFYVAHVFGLGVGYRDLRLRIDDPGEGLTDTQNNGFQGYLLFRF
jgi:hypothetical protein